MARTAFTLRLTTPAGDVHTLPVKPSTMILLEERLGIPVWERFRQGYSGSFARLGFAVGQDAGVIPADRTFEDFVDSDEQWVIDVVDVDSDPVADAEGNA